MCLYGHQDNHGNLRTSVANYIRSLAETAAADKRVALIQRADIAAKDRVWVTEDLIMAAAEYLHRNIHIYISAKQSSPLVYSPSSGSNYESIFVAFYEPGHYMAVVKNTFTNAHSALPHTGQPCHLSQSTSLSSSSPHIAPFVAFPPTSLADFTAPGNPGN